MPFKLKSFLAIALILFLHSYAFSQIKLNGKSVICEGDLGSFTFSVPSGKTAKTYLWDFGDTYTSTKAGPTHLFKTTGKYTVKLKVTYTTGQVATFSLPIDVVALPNASFQWQKTNDTCHFTNNVCFSDQSSPAVSSRPIVKRTYFWGDGKFDESRTPKSGDRSCHVYNLPDSFYVEMEVEDKLGCKSTANRNVVILKSVKASFGDKITYKNCTSADVCFTNNSTVSNGSKISYKWTFSDTSSVQDHFLGNSICSTYTSSAKIRVKLLGISSGGCHSFYEKNLTIEIPKSDRKIYTSNTKYCYGERRIFASIDLVKGESARWYFDTRQGPSSDTWSYNFSADSIKLGKHKVSCEVWRGGCRKVYSQTIEILGPIAKIKMFNSAQCQTNRKVFFVDRSEFADSSNMTSKWVVWDKQGDNCIINRSQNLNRNKNCNTTIGWFGKHQFANSGVKSSLNYTIKDTSTGCSDALVGYIDLNSCGACSRGTIRLCGDGTFIKNQTPGNGNPEKFSLDTGKTWLPFPSKLSGQPVGNYQVGLIFKQTGNEWVEEIGNDSIRVNKSPHTTIDTVFIDDLLIINRTINDNVTFDFDTTCNPHVGQVHLSEGVFFPGEAIQISWGDGEKTYIRWSDTIRQKLFRHNYKHAGGSGKVIVQLMSTGSCTVTHSLDYEFGYEPFFATGGNHCLGDTLILVADIRSYPNNVRWDTSNQLGSVKWLLNSEPLGTDYIEKYKYDSIGVYKFDLITTSRKGCRDTISDSFSVHHIIAGIKDESKDFFCDGQRTFYDSSAIIEPSRVYGRITKYLWDFGTGVFSSFEKNPTVAFDGTKKNLLIRHKVLSNQGCSDEDSFYLRVLTSRPLIKPVDSVGCAPFNAVFKNHTIGANQYIWELGDTSNITIEQDSLMNQKYTYHTPGEYFIRLIGIDSFLNTKTGFIETCHTVYPPLGKKGVKISVLPSKHLGITGPDTLCLGETGTFNSLSFQDYDSEVWRVNGDTGLYQKIEGGIEQKFTHAGTQTVSISPKYLNLNVVPKCIQKIEKKVEIIDVISDFTIDNSYNAPIFGFLNYSETKNASFSWDFGQPNSGNQNKSSLYEPSHDYGKDTGQFVVCLVARVAQCSDTMCLKIDNPFVKIDTTIDNDTLVDQIPANKIILYNVFTPGNVDGKNDKFIVDLVNQRSHELVIFNRWGDVVFESYKNQSRDDSLVWNGKLNNDGEPCPSGTYFYVLKYAYLDSPVKEESVNGTVTLLRN